ncbi:MAG: ATP-binding cassette domain-containing protein [Deltaproteobacteria bacterium]|jgi:iron complex transport system ATP-binding protein
MSHSNIIRLSNVTVRRGSKTILDGINWTVEQGQHWVILGANGAGKTSLLNTLTAYFTISQGEFELLGYKYGTSDWRELRKKIGVVSDSIIYKINFFETCIETVASGKEAMINYWGRIPQEEHDRAIEILSKIECDHLAERRWGSLSEGEKQRILIGRALMADSRVLILDEPCAGLDPVARENFLAFLSRLAQDNRALVLLFVTHHVEEIMPFLSHVLIMKDGKILAAGEKEKVLISATLSKAFDTDIELCRENSRYSISIKTQIDVVL